MTMDEMDDEDDDEMDDHQDDDDDDHPRPKSIKGRAVPAK